MRKGTNEKSINFSIYQCTAYSQQIKFFLPSPIQVNVKITTFYHLQKIVAPQVRKKGFLYAMQKYPIFSPFNPNTFYNLLFA
jgi:hypothetical protein